MKVKKGKMTTEERTKKAKKFFNETAPFVECLAFRWDNEKEYEDINDYKTALQKKGKEFGVKILKMTKRPFGFTWKLGKATYKTKTTSKNISMARIR